MIPSQLQDRLQSGLNSRRDQSLLRSLSAWEGDPTWINLADNDYLGLSRDEAVIAAAREAASRYGCSSSASPLISGYQLPHQALEFELQRWHGFSSGLVWNSGYTANQSVLSHLPQRGDLVLADRLIHNSMVNGILQSGARLIRYRHNDVEHLRSLLEEHAGGEGITFVVTESVFSMDGDAPDLAAIAGLKKRFPFCLVLDEAHATGWYGPNGSGLAAECGVVEAVDVFVGTLGKTLGSQGAYTLFHDPVLREYLVNQAGEFIYSTYLSPIAAVAALTAIGRVRDLFAQQADWRRISRDFRESLRANNWDVPSGDSAIVPVILGDGEQVLGLASFLREHKIRVGAIRPPTVPVGGSRLRLSLRRSFTSATAGHLMDLFNEWRNRQP